MPINMTQEEFIRSAGCQDADWERTGLCWENLLAIAAHHDAALPTLSLHGGTIANRIQAFAGVHSVRWRVKDTHGLLKKILRKNLEEPRQAKWQTINTENYRSVVSDLIGVRALHLLREDCSKVDQQIRNTWNAHDITIFKRDGDSNLSEIIERGATEKLHSAGYRSIHYGLSYQPEKEPILVEVQVRTIFQEAWSEIDHKVRYPDFSDNDLLKYFLSVFNGLAGTADDMGSVVMKLDSLIKMHSAAILKNEIALKSRDADIDKLQLEIDKLRTEGSASPSTIESLQTSVDKIKDNEASSRNNEGFARALGVSAGKYLNEDQLKALKNLFKPDPNFMAAISSIGAQSAVFSDSIANITRQNAELINATQQIVQPNVEIMAAIANTMGPIATFAEHVDQQQHIRDASIVLADLSKHTDKS